MRRQRGSTPSDPPQHQPLSRCDPEIHRLIGSLNRCFDLFLLEITHREPEQGVCHTTDLIPEKRFPFDFKPHQPVAIHPWLGVKNRSYRVLSLFESGKVSGIVGANEHRKPPTKRLLVGFVPVFHGLKAVSVDTVQRQSGVKIGFDLFHREEGDGAVQTIVHRSNHFPRGQRCPEIPFQIDDASVDADMNSCVGSTREDKQLLFNGPCKPLEGAKHSNQFTLNGAYVGLNLTPVETISKVADSEKQPNLLGQWTLSSLVGVQRCNGLFFREPERAHRPFEGLLEPGLNHGGLAAGVHHLNGVHQISAGCEQHLVDGNI